jgi:hypothetical protein
MLTTIPRLADKAFIIGYLLPTGVFLIAITILFSDVAFFSAVNSLIQSDRSFDKILYLGLALWGASIILMIANHNIYQFVEGYTWPIPQLASKFGSTEVNRFKRLSKQLSDLGRRWTAAGERFPNKERQKYDEILVKLRTQFPSHEEYVLPTRFGNAIAAFEDYSREIYGADPIPLWIHLNTVVPKEFASSIEDAKTNVTFLMNAFVFSAMFSILSLCRFLINLEEYSLGHNHPTTNFYSYELVALASGIVARLTYELSIEKIYSWGTLVKATFDCYLPALAEKLGYKLPSKGEEQKRFWTAVSRRAAYHRPLKPEDWPRLDAPESKESVGGASSVEVADEKAPDNDSEDQINEEYREPESSDEETQESDVEGK